MLLAALLAVVCGGGVARNSCMAVRCAERWRGRQLCEDAKICVTFVYNLRVFGFGFISTLRSSLFLTTTYYTESE